MKRRDNKSEKVISLFICVCMMLSIAASCAFAEDEENLNPTINEAGAETVEESAPAEEKTEEPSPAEEKTEEPAPAEEKTEEPAPAAETTEEPAPAEEKTEELSPAEEKTEEPALAEETTEEPAPAEEKTEESAPAEETTEEFDLEKAYEHYLSLEEDWQKEQYLNSLSSEQRNALKQYIAEKEAEAAEIENTPDSPEENGSEEDNEKEEDEEPAAEDGLNEDSGAEEPEDSQPENSGDDDSDPDDGNKTEEPEEEPEKETHISFGSAHIGGEWFGRGTSTVRNLTILIYIDGNLADTCCSSANKSVADFVIYSGDNEIIDVTSNCWELTGSGNMWSVDMYGANNVTVNVNMKSFLAGEEIGEKTEEEIPEENLSGDTAELSEENTTEPSYEITIPVSRINMSQEAGTAKLTIDASCTDMNGQRLDVSCRSDHGFHFVYGAGKDSIEYGLYSSEEGGEKLSSGQAVASFTEDASASIYLKVSNGDAAKYAGIYEDIITFAVEMVSAD